jgi:hypothetical protein
VDQRDFSNIRESFGPIPEDMPMPFSDQLELAFVISVFVIFGVVLAYGSWQESLINKRKSSSRPRE